MLIETARFLMLIGALICAGAVLIPLSLSVYRRDGRW